MNTEKTYLLDVNVLISLTWPNHVHHDLVRMWFRKLDGPWATCPLTQTSFVRISSNPAIVGETVQPQQALNILKELTSMSNHSFLHRSIDLTEIKDIPHQLFFGHRQVTDFYLLLLAKETGCIFATLDHRLYRGAQSAGFASSIELIRASVTEE
jgi:hypothetical protein